MRRTLLGASVLALFGLILNGNLAHAQLKPLASTGWGSLSGKVTLDGPIPPIVDLTDKMKGSNDAACCLADKAKNKVDQTWIVDPKTKAVANVVVWIKAPKGTFLPTNAKFQKRDDTVVIDQPHCAFLPRVSAFNPVYRTANGEVPTGQKMILKNDSVVNHNVRALGHPDKNPGFNINLPSKTELDVSKRLQPQTLPISIQCDIHPWMQAKLFVFDHPYYAISKEDGTFEIPIVPAGAEVSIMAWHEGVGWVLTNQGKKMTLQPGKNTMDIGVPAPK